MALQDEIDKAVNLVLATIFLLSFFGTVIATDQYDHTPQCVSDIERAEAGILPNSRTPTQDCR